MFSLYSLRYDLSIQQAASEEGSQQRVRVYQYPHIPWLGSLTVYSYIKELAERVVSLERASGTLPYTHAAGGMPMADFNAYSPSNEFMGSEPRKRTHSMADGSQGFGSAAEQLQTYAKGYTPNMSSTAPEGPFFRGAFDPSQSMGGDISSLGGEPIDE